MKFLKVIFSLAVALSFVGGIEAVSIKEARAAGKLKVKNNTVRYDGSIRLTWKLDSWEGIVELARDYPDLKVLNLWRNKLTSIPPEIGQLQNLKVLGLDGNHLTSLPAELGELTKLRELFLRRNRLTSLPPEIGQLKNLQRLSLFKNKLTSLPPEIERLKNLQRLSLKGNRLNNAQALGTLARMKWLKELIIANNRLSLKQGRWIKKQLPHTKVYAHLY